MCRIGEDLYIEPNATQLVMHTTNSWHTVYAWFTFDASFFSSYYFTKDDEQNSESSLKCKISLKVLYFNLCFFNLLLIENSIVYVFEGNDRGIDMARYITKMSNNIVWVVDRFLELVI